MDEQTNIDFLAWFSDEERGTCAGCGERACVTLPDALASFCLACGAITIDGAEVEIPPDPVYAHRKAPKR